MIVKIPQGGIKKTLPNGRTVKTIEIVPVVIGRPNLRKIDLTEVEFINVPIGGAATIPWKKLVAFMQRKLRKGFVTLGTREFMAIFCDKKVNEWLAQESPKSPWKMGNGGLIGFPDGLVKIEGRSLSYDVALWSPREKHWHVRIFDPEQGAVYPSWYDFLRLPVYKVQ
jgi:hypothetical protein